MDVVEVTPFAHTLKQHRLEIRRKAPAILQLNIGKLCNLACSHCHVNAGPWRKEIMTRATIDKILAWLEPTPIQTVDLTGGAPEMMPDFRYLIQALKKQAQPRHIIDRCNLTIIVQPGYEYLAEFLAEHEVEIVASMPCYSHDNVDAQRGDGVFDASIKALQHLNGVGYGIDPTLSLHLVYNPVNPQLPPAQAALEADYKAALQKHFNIVFNRLYTITNMPIARYESYLKQNQQLTDYYQLLIDNFNPATVDGLMCRDTINVSYDGRVYDCDFNQMLALPMQHQAHTSPYLWELNPQDLQQQPIVTANHCYGCTAGAGSSCQGATT